MSTLFNSPQPIQPNLAFPQSLTVKHRPRVIDGFVGLDKPKALARALTAKPFESGWLFLGPSGTGKRRLLSPSLKPSRQKFTTYHLRSVIWPR